MKNETIGLGEAKNDRWYAYSDDVLVVYIEDGDLSIGTINGVKNDANDSVVAVFDDSVVIALFITVKDDGNEPEEEINAEVAISGDVSATPEDYTTREDMFYLDPGAYVLTDATTESGDWPSGLTGKPEENMVFVYALDKAEKSTKFTIKDSEGNVVFSETNDSFDADDNTGKFLFYVRVVNNTDVEGFQKGGSFTWEIRGQNNGLVSAGKFTIENYEYSAE